MTVAGITEEIAKKRTNNCCWISCSDYHGPEPKKKWSNWSPYRVDYPLPTDDTEVDNLCTRLRKADPELDLEKFSIYTSYRESYFDPDYLSTSVCGNCANVCWEKRDDRQENRRLLANSGIVILKTNGERMAVNDENEIVEVDTIFNVRVALLRKEYKAALKGEIPLEIENTHNLRDKEVLVSLLKGQ